MALFARVEHHEIVAQACILRKGVMEAPYRGLGRAFAIAAGAAKFAKLAVRIRETPCCALSLTILSVRLRFLAWEPLP